MSPLSALPVSAAASIVSRKPPGATTLNAFSTPSARVTRSRIACLRERPRRSRCVMRPIEVRKSVVAPISTTPVQSQPRATASFSSSRRSTVLPTPRRPE